MSRNRVTRFIEERDSTISPGKKKEESLADRVAAIAYWYHKIELPDGVVTPGWAPINAESYGVPENLSGKRVLDVGAWDGYWTFEAMKRGAREVVAIDDFSDFLGKLDESERPAWETFDLCRDALGYDEKICSRREMSVYDITQDELGRFDFVFCFGVLYHLRHPLLAIDRLAEICDEALLIESAILDDYSPYRGGLGHGYGDGQMVMEFYPDEQYGNNDTNFWVPTLNCLGHMVRSAGFAKTEGRKLIDNPQNIKFCRGFISARRT